jgi:hypothetical protein
VKTGTEAFRYLQTNDYLLLETGKTLKPEELANEGFEMGLAGVALKVTPKRKTEKVFYKLPSDMANPDSFPNEQTVLFLAWLAVANGARGIFYGPFGNLGPQDCLDMLSETAPVNYGLERLSGVIEKGTPVDTPFKTSAPLKTFSWKKGGKIYTVLINTDSPLVPAPAEILSGSYKPMLERSRDVKKLLYKQRGNYFLQGHRVLLLEK